MSSRPQWTELASKSGTSGAQTLHLPSQAIYPWKDTCSLPAVPALHPNSAFVQSNQFHKLPCLAAASKYLSILPSLSLSSLSSPILHNSSNTQSHFSPVSHSHSSIYPQLPSSNTINSSATSSLASLDIHTCRHHGFINGRQPSDGHQVQGD